MTTLAVMIFMMTVNTATTQAIITTIFQIPLILLMNPQHVQTQDHQEEEECRWGHAVVMMMIMMMMVTDVVAGMEILIAKMKIMITEDLEIETAAAIEAHR